MSQYEVIKCVPPSRGWRVLRDGKFVTYGQADTIPQGFTRKRDAKARIVELQASDAYRALVLEQDKTQKYVWTADEEKQIAEYAEVLRANELRWTFHGQFPIQETARKQHVEDAKKLTHTNWIDCEFYHANTRRTMAARVEAFKRIGEVL